MVIFLYGADSFRSRDSLRRLVEKFKRERDPSGYNVVQLDAADDTDAQRIIAEMLSVPFLAERRMIVIEHLLSAKVSELQEAVLQRMEEKKLPESNVIILWEDVDSFKTKLAKAFAERLAKEPFSQRFDALTGIKLQEWIESEVTRRGGTIEKNVAPFLANYGSDDLWFVSTVIDQLIAYAIENGKPRPITTSDVRLFVPEAVSDEIFPLVDAIVAGRGQTVFAEIHEQYRKGEDVQYLFAMVLRQFRILLELRDMLEREDMMTSDVAAKRTGIHPFVVKKSWPLVKQFTVAELRQIYHEFLVLDEQIKTTGMDDQVLFDVLVGRVVQTR